MLLIDLGNTRGKLVMVSNGELQPSVYWDYDHDIVSLLNQLNPSAIYMASVAPLRIEQRIIDAAVAAGIAINRVTTEAERFGVVNGYDDYHQMGIDRWLAMIGARQLRKQACVVVDAGTAVTIDALDHQGHHLGGWIIPGLALMTTSLMQRSDKLNVPAAEFGVGFGFATGQAISRGALHAVAGAVEQACALVADSVTPTPMVVVTGGDAQTVAAALSAPTQIVPDLVFKGLRCYAEAI
ncbi:hypothetical protein GCM10011369_28320 [Neiella marina]|uniref:Type III pantothenate kinase n=1 Tax=Neiella marina TaxID=508461 RepID=A0A8J2XQE0_9GAMM|nr:type III pantothenate kinase [Neiella marina]GGA84605.1 hypothetical protein GCM10011369_28320 [Neiella marina]